MRGGCRECFPCHQLQRKPLVSDPGMHHGACVTHVSWCMSGSLTRSGVENVPGIPGACTTHNFTYLARGPWTITLFVVPGPRCQGHYKRFLLTMNIFRFQRLFWSQLIVECAFWYRVWMYFNDISYRNKWGNYSESRWFLLPYTKILFTYVIEFCQLCIVTDKC